LQVEEQEKSIRTAAPWQQLQGNSVRQTVAHWLMPSTATHGATGQAHRRF